MTVTITIIGLGRIGTSIGLALGQHLDKVTRRGLDIHPEISQQAKRMGAVDKTYLNLPAAVRDSDLVIMALPLDQVQETIAIIAPELKEGAVVIDAAPAKRTVADWMAAALPEGRYYLGIVPILNSHYLKVLDTGINAAQADLFVNGKLGVVAGSDMVGGALKLVSDFADLLGAEPLFIEPVEVDSYLAATQLLPQLVAAGLLGGTVHQPGWEESGSTAGSAYASAAGVFGLVDTSASLASAAVKNQDQVLRVLDNVLGELENLRETIRAADAAALEVYFADLAEKQQQWWAKRQNPKSSDGRKVVSADQDVPSLGEEMRRWVFGGRRTPKK